VIDTVIEFDIIGVTVNVEYTEPEREEDPHVVYVGEPGVTLADALEETDGDAEIEFDEDE